MEDLPAGTKYEVRSKCCNNIGCNEEYNITTSTQLAKPFVDGTLILDRVTDTNATLTLPRVASGDAAMLVNYLVFTRLLFLFLLIIINNKYQGSILPLRGGPDDNCEFVKVLI